jgi:hypothetical protein
VGSEQPETNKSKKKMKNLIRIEHLANGLTVEFHDRSNRYYGDYYRVCVEVRCRIPLSAAAFSEAADPVAEMQHARTVLGEEMLFAHTLEQMGVSGDDVEKNRQALIDSFVKSTFPYMQSPSFPARMMARELAQRKKRRSFSAPK